MASKSHRAVQKNLRHIRLVSAYLWLWRVPPKGQSVTQSSQNDDCLIPRFFLGYAHNTVFTNTDVVPLSMGILSHIIDLGLFLASSMVSGKMCIANDITSRQSLNRVCCDLFLLVLPAISLSHNIDK